MKHTEKTVFTGILLICLVLCGCTSAPAGKSQPTGSIGAVRPPKNIIVLIGDGCGFYQLQAGALYQDGRLGNQCYDRFPVRLAMSTYSIGGSYDANSAWSNWDYVKRSATDSAAAATAMATGVKTYDSAIGVDSKRQRLTNITERAEQLGKATGVVTTVPFSHATPAGFVAHNNDRDNYHQLADEMICDTAVDVIMGCGHPLHDRNGQRNRSEQLKYIGREAWAKLTQNTPCSDADADGKPDAWTFIQTRQEFQKLMTGPAPSRVFGLAQVSETLQLQRSGGSDSLPFQTPVIPSVPTLEEMTRAAINVLDDDPDGFFVMIEGGAIDWAGHGNNSGRLVEEVVDFTKAIEAVLAWVEQNSNWNDTLVIITADHETGYLTGPGSGNDLFKGPAWQDLASNGPGKLPGMKWNDGGHTNSLVPFYARGQAAQLFKETIDGTDPVRGDYIDNTDIGRTILGVWSMN